MHNPPHPGELVPRGVPCAAAPERDGSGRVLGVTCKALSELINGHSGISPGMAIRLSKAFGSEPETWPGMQMEYDLWHASRRASRLKVEKLYSGERKAA